MPGVLNKDPNVWLGGARPPPPPISPYIIFEHFLLKMINKICSQNQKMFKTQIFIFILFHLAEEWNWSKKFDIARPYSRLKIESWIYTFSILTTSNTGANTIKLFKVVIPRRNKVECLSLATMEVINTLAFCCPCTWTGSNSFNYVQVERNLFNTVHHPNSPFTKFINSSWTRKNDTQHNNK